MDLYNMMRNISGKDIEKELVQAITIIKHALDGLTTERMCKVYNGYLLRELIRRHISARLINTLDLNLSYEHVFILIRSNEIGYFLADLTFPQFNIKIKCLSQLFKNGYQAINDIDFNYYLDIISKENIKFEYSVEKTFYSLKSNQIINQHYR